MPPSELCLRTPTFPFELISSIGCHCLPSAQFCCVLICFDILNNKKRFKHQLILCSVFFQPDTAYQAPHTYLIRHKTTYACVYMDTKMLYVLQYNNYSRPIFLVYVTVYKWPLQYPSQPHSGLSLILGAAASTGNSFIFDVTYSSSQCPLHLEWSILSPERIGEY